MRKFHRLFGLLMISTLLLTGGFSFAGEMEKPEHLSSLAIEYLNKKIKINTDEKLEIKLSEAASQLRLPVCANPITLGIPSTASEGHINTLEMTCKGSTSWHVYVPIDMKILTPVVVTRETIPHKTTIGANMLELAYRDRNSLYSGYFRDVSEVAGQISLSTVVAGTVLTRRNIQQPIIIKRNQSVSIISRRGHIMVTANGTAKSAGAINDRIKVLNTSSKRIVDATVINSSSVEVGE
tara:strand:+ start:223 stop:936 length:714 start_codon:yes stop_codon:yes gene_type:complete